MKKWMIYLLGVLTGFVLTVLVAFVIYSNRPESNQDKFVGSTETDIEQPDGVKMFKEPGDVINERSFEVFQVVAENGALVTGKGDGNYMYTGPVYLLINDDGKYYYDEEIIKLPKGKVVRQVGIYQYETKQAILKTVPIIEFLNE
jgi:hypothetical protein